MVAHLGTGASVHIRVDLRLRRAVDIDAAGIDARSAWAAVGAAADGTLRWRQHAVASGRARRREVQPATNVAAYRVEASDGGCPAGDSLAIEGRRERCRRGCRERPRYDVEMVVGKRRRRPDRLAGKDVGLGLAGERECQDEENHRRKPLKGDRWWCHLRLDSQAARVRVVNFVDQY